MYVWEKVKSGKRRGQSLSLRRDCSMTVLSNLSVTFHTQNVHEEWWNISFKFFCANSKFSIYSWIHEISADSDHVPSTKIYIEPISQL